MSTGNYNTIPYLIENFEEVVTASIYPKWYECYRFFKDQDLEIATFYLNREDWSQRMSSLLLTAGKRIVWALDMPSLSEDNRHLLLYSMSHAMRHDVSVVAYFRQTDKKNAPLTRFDSLSGDKTNLNVCPDDFSFPFVIIDDLLIFERPAKASHKQRYCYMIKNCDSRLISHMVSLPWLRLENKDKKTLMEA